MPASQFFQRSTVAGLSYSAVGMSFYLLEDAVVARGWVTRQAFLAGYGAAQAVPGPLFSFAAYLGAEVSPTPGPLRYGVMGLVGLFWPVCLP
jgi:chromate transport protein ChrA